MKKANDIMTKGPDCVNPGDSVQRAAQLMRDGEFGIVPVVDDQFRLQGLVTDRDIAIRCVAQGRGEDCDVSEVMTSDNLETVRPSDDLGSVFQLMEREQVRRVPVVEDGGRIVGLIAQADIALHAEKDAEIGELLEKISEPFHRGGH